MKPQGAFLAAEWKILDAVKGAGKFDSPLYEDLHWIFLTSINLTASDTVQVSIKSWFSSPQNYHIIILISAALNDLSNLTEFNFGNPHLFL